jgi:class 3 adenylate cyclase/DNA-binding winged helix-turn-helix (wHTH) protein/tetratricopeptide (TPR) repeat protein
VEAVTMIYAFGAYTFDTQLYELRRAGELIPLGPQVFDVLAYLVQHRQRVVPKQELFERLWPGQFVGDDALERCIRAARRALGDTRQAPPLIQTVRGRGYRFMAPVEVQPHDAPSDERPAAPPTSALPVSQATDGADKAPPSLPVQVVSGTRRPTHSQPEGEHKAVTVLCCELAEAGALAIHLGPEAMHYLMQTLFATAQEVVQRYEGTIVQFGGHGFHALFGADVAQEDHARRAVLAAVELQQHLHERLPSAGLPPEQAPGVGIGLHTGVVVVGRLGTGPQRIYTATGQTTALATRLQHRATPGAVLMSEATWQLVQDEVQVEPRGAITVEERSIPVPVYAFCRMTRRRSGVSGRGKRARSPFVGRALEMTLLRERLAQVEDGRGQAVGIAGEPGIGKSRLLEEFRRNLADRPVTYCEGHCLSYGSTTPYLPVLGLLRQLCGITDAGSSQAVAAQVRQQLQEVELDPEEAAPYLLYLLSIAAGTERLTALSPEELKARTFACLRQFSLQRSRRQPLILAVENLHWIDATSEEYLTSLVERLAGAPILLLATYRPGYRPPWLEKSAATQLALPGLTAHDSLVVVQSVPQTRPLADALQQEIVGKAAGNPFFLEELTRAVVAEGTRPATLVVPDTIQAVLAARMDQLLPEEKRLLQTAAVIGMNVPLPLLLAIAEMSEDALSRGLAHLQAVEFLYETQLIPEPEYTFKHALTHEVAYGSLLQERRRVLHARILEAIEWLAAERLAEQVERLALHALRGDVWGKAVTYCQQAGARAHDRAAFHEAVASFEHALQALAHLHEESDSRMLAIEIRLALGAALRTLGEYGRCLALLGEAESLARALDDGAHLGRVLAQMAFGLRVIGALDGARAAGRQALELAAALGDRALQGQAAHRLGQVYYALGDFGRAAELLHRNVEAVDGESGTPSTDVRLESRAWLAWTLSALGAFAEGRRHGEEALRLTTMEGRGDTPLVVHNCLGHLYLAQGDLAHAIRLFEQGLALCRTSGDRIALRSISAGLGYAYALQGRVAEGRMLLAEGIGEAIHTGGRQNPQRVAWLSEVCRLAGHGGEAWQHARQALDLARQQKARGDEALALYQLGIVQAHADPPEIAPAEAHYQQALALAGELGMRPLQAHCHLALGTLYTKTGHSEQGQAELSAAIDLYRAMDMTFWLPQAEAALVQVV